MYRTVPYIVLFLILALLQIFLFDNLSISIYLCPLVYIGFIVLLPIDAPPVAVLFPVSYTHLTLPTKLEV